MYISICKERLASLLLFNSTSIFLLINSIFFHEKLFKTLEMHIFSSSCVLVPLPSICELWLYIAFIGKNKEYSGQLNIRAFRFLTFVKFFVYVNVTVPKSATNLNNLFLLLNDTLKPESISKSHIPNRSQRFPFFFFFSIFPFKYVPARLRFLLGTEIYRVGTIYWWPSTIFWWYPSVYSSIIELVVFTPFTFHGSSCSWTPLSPTWSTC